MSLPITLLAVALGCSLVLMRTPVSDRVGFDSIGRLALCGLCVGSLFTVNSWDYPTYALFVAACIVLGIYLNDLTTEWWKRCVFPLCIFGSISLLLYAPFYVHFRSLAHGVGVVSRPTDVFEFFQVFGLLFLAPALLVLALCLLVRPTEERVTEEPFDSDISTRGSAMAKHEVGMTAIDYALIVAVFIVGGVILHRIVLLLALGLVGAAGTALYRVVNTDEPNRADALALLLVILGGSVLALTEVLYLRDVFDGGTSYRMNTVFKFYYQAWVLLSLSAAYAAFRAPEVLRLLLGLRYARLALALVTLGTAGAAVYTWFVPSYAVAFSHQRSMDGMAWVRHQYPDDYAAIQWLNGHALGTPVILEATQGEYGYFSRISTFSGLPTVMGWAGHENQWRPGDQDIARRIADVKSIYTSDANSAQQLLRRYDVRYVIVGDPERQAYGNGPGLHKFGTFMREAFRSGTTTVYVRA